MIVTGENVQCAVCAIHEHSIAYFFFSLVFNHLHNCSNVRPRIRAHIRKYLIYHIFFNVRNVPLTGEARAPPLAGLRAYLL